jgi:hypothetical protein
MVRKAIAQEAGWLDHRIDQRITGLDDRIVALAVAQATEHQNIYNTAQAIQAAIVRSLVDISPKVVAERSAMLRAYTAEPIRLQSFDNDPATLDAGAGPSYYDVSEKTVLPCPQNARNAVLLIAGQSLVDNHVDELHKSSSSQVVNFNIYDGKCYAAEDPLLGTSGAQGDFATRLAMRCSRPTSSTASSWRQSRSAAPI